MLTTQLRRTGRSEVTRTTTSPLSRPGATPPGTNPFSRDGYRCQYPDVGCDELARSLQERFQNAQRLLLEAHPHPALRELGVSVSNLLDDRHYQFFGAPLLGRRAVVHFTFSR